MNRYPLPAIVLLTALGLGGCSSNSQAMLPFADPALSHGSTRSLSSLLKHESVVVPNLIANSITTYPLNANGDVAPIRTISGTLTTLSTPLATAEDRHGGIYESQAGSINFFGPGANGNVAPTSAITVGSNGPRSIALDASGNLYASNFSAASITAYAPDASGVATPIVTISGAATTLKEPFGLAIGASGNVYDTDVGSNDVVVFAAGANGNVAPIRSIAGTSTGFTNLGGIAVDSAGNIYVANEAPDAIFIFGPGASGNVLPTTTIAGASTGLSSPAGVAVDSAGNIYVANHSANTITVYGPGASGNVPPIATISGATTGLNFPFLLSLGR